MPKQRGPSAVLFIRLPLEIRARLDIALVSELEGRVPYGVYSQFISERILEYFSWGGLDLTPFGFREGFFVRGPKEMVRALREKLENKS